MNLQKACEVLEGLLERDIKRKVLNMKEFIALNKVLLECEINLGYNSAIKKGV